MSDAVNHPSYYGGKIEVIDFIEDKELGFHLGNAVKYIARAGRKDPSKTIEDLKKAVWYVERYIDLLVSEEDEETEKVPEDGCYKISSKDYPLIEEFYREETDED